MNKITDDLKRQQTPNTFCEELNFRCDSGYNLNTIYRRALSVLERALAQGHRADPLLGLQLHELPPFDPQNRLRVTIELLPPQEVKEEASQAVGAAQGK